MQNDKDSYLIGKAFRSFLLASILTSVVSQINVMVDSILVGNLISPVALSAVNISIPVNCLLSGIMVLFIGGSGVLSAKALGAQKYQEANMIYTVAFISSIVIMTVVSIFGWLYVSDITGYLCKDAIFRPYVESYIRILIPGYIAATALQCMCNFVNVDGRPKLVTVSVIGSAVTNLLFDIIFIKYLGLGIGGAALASVVGCLVALAVMIVVKSRYNNSFHFVLPDSHFGVVLKQNMVQGMPPLLGNFVLCLLYYSINGIIMSAQGALGIFVMSICLQIIMLGVMGFDGAGLAILSIGGRLIGENDMHGLRLLVRKCLLFLVSVLGAVSVYVLIAPQSLAQLFGCHEPVKLAASVIPIRMFIFCLIPYGLVETVRYLYQTLGYIKASMTFTVLPVVILISAMWVLSKLGGDWLWTSFVLSYGLSLLIMLLFSLSVKSRRPDMQLLTLIPAENHDKSLKITVAYTSDDVSRALDKLRCFWEDAKLDAYTLNNALNCCEEMMYNIQEHATNQPDKHYFDVHTYIGDEKLTITLKDDGRPFNPVFTYVQPTKEQLLSGKDIKLGLTLVNGLCKDINYKYLYGQNIVYLNFMKGK